MMSLTVESSKSCLCKIDMDMASIDLHYPSDLSISILFERSNFDIGPFLSIIFSTSSAVHELNT